MSKTPHKHSAIIKAWADGATIQFRDRPSTTWDMCMGNPEFRLEAEYRALDQHQDARDAYAAGKQIEFRCASDPNGPWNDVGGEPCWFSNLVYRAKQPAPHKWQHVLDAQAAGKPIQAKWEGSKYWVDGWGGYDCNDPGAEYRIKHKYQDVIDALAAGVKIEFKSQMPPYDWIESELSPDSGALDRTYEWRVKPIRLNQDMIDARADGKTIQFKSKLSDGLWYDISQHNDMQDDYTYRIKLLNQEFLDARADGKVIQYKSKFSGDWNFISALDTMQDDFEHRIQPVEVHPHQALMDAHAAGATIEYLSSLFGGWRVTDSPLWFKDHQYRIKNKDQEVIDAQAAGKTIQFKSKFSGNWMDFSQSPAPYPEYEWRIKPEPVKFRPALMSGAEGKFWVSVEAAADGRADFVRFIGDEVTVAV